MGVQSEVVRGFMEVSPRRAAFASSPPPGRGRGRAPVLRLVSQDAPRLRREQVTADEIQVRQGEERPGSSEILGEAAIADLREAPEALHDVEGVLPTLPRPPPGPVAG